MSSKQVTRIAIFSALAFVLRMAFGQLPNIQPITALFFVFSIFFGLYEAYLVMFTTLFLTSFLLGFGPWVFWQITIYMLLLTIWRSILYPFIRKWHKQGLLIQAGVVAFLALLYGVLIDSCFAYLYSMPYWSYILLGIPFDIAHAISSFLFYLVIITIFRRLFYEKNS
ncbi:ECF transporter S component [Streptococcus hongkongensis]|nr:membrane protein [Streptococcus uberis]